MKIKKYIKKPIPIEALQWTGDNKQEIINFIDDNTRYQFIKTSTSYNLYISTLEGEMKASIGDYIVKGVDGEFYPCKPGIFEKTYEEVSNAN